jgi:DNA helicase-2/ATP-dependent DNA helicase PcrA
MEISFLNELNENQRKAVEYNDGPSLVIAGAGSGKTRVLTYKIAYLLKKGVPASSILALTFTNKAAREMKNRIATLVGEKTARYLWMGTFHSIFSRILRAEEGKTGFSKNFTIYDSSDSASLIKSIIKEMKLDDKVYKPGFVHSRISFAKNNLITHEAYRANADFQKADFNARIPMLKEIYTAYCNRCKQADAMDFDDLLLQTNILFRNHPEVLHKYQKTFSYILVDEYQDTNFAQYLIVKKLAEQHERICVVGDDAQSIYSFRGANIDNILQFKTTYQNAEIFKLEQNYRSTQNIVNAANSLIKKNERQIHKQVFSERETGQLISVYNTPTDHEEGELVAKQILKLKTENKIAFQHIAILYRTNAQSRVLEEAMRKNYIPYRIYGGLSFYQRKEIKDVIAYCRLVSNPHDEEALKRIINFPARGIGDTTLTKIFECAQLHLVSAWEVISDMLRYNLPVNAGTASKLSNFRNLISTFAAQSDTLNAYELVTEIVKITGIISETYTDTSPENISRQENIQELLKAIHEFCENRKKNGETALISDFLSEVSLLTDQDTDKEADTDKITMMTVHAAKGLEFIAVFIVGMEEDLFPSGYNISSPRDLEEERRLFYVAITRAEEFCTISYARTRFRNGSMNFCNPSRFIRDIDAHYLKMHEQDNFTERLNRFDRWENDLNAERTKGGNKPEIETFSNEVFKPAGLKRMVKLESSSTEKKQINSGPYQQGVRVKHAIFGIGKILDVYLDGGNEKAEIDFGAKGKKTLLMKFAKLEIIS